MSLAYNNDHKPMTDYRFSNSNWRNHHHQQQQQQQQQQLVMVLLCPIYTNPDQ